MKNGNTNNRNIVSLNHNIVLDFRVRVIYTEIVIKMEKKR